MPVISCISKNITITPNNTTNVNIVPNNNNQIKIIQSSGLLSVPVKEVFSFTDMSLFPLVGVSDTIYIDESSSIMYRWDGLSYVPMSSNSSGAGLFITDVSNRGSGIIGSKQFVPNTVPTNRVILSAMSDDSTARIHFLAEGGDLYSPIVTLNAVPCDNLIEVVGDIRMFEGYFDVDVPVTTVFTIEHSNGNSADVTISRAPAGPVINSVHFVNGYPLTQSEVKSGDTFDVEIQFDSNGTEPISVTFDDYGCTTGGVFSLATTELNWGTVHKATITLTIKATSSIPTVLPCRCNAVNSFGTSGNTVLSDADGAVNGTNTVICNDIVPTFNDNGTTFPLTQAAFKNNETGSKEVSVSDFTSISYSSPTNDFIITNPTVYNASKNITCTHPATYNDSVNNFRIVADRVENGTQSTFNCNIEVADIAPLITVTQQFTRLRSSSIGESYTITATSNQNMAGTPAMDISIPVSGTWQGSWIGGSKIKTRSITINDNDAKGTGNWTFNTIPTNNAGIPSTITGIENVGGFIPRTLTIDAWMNREVLIGTNVVDTTKLTCENLSKGGSAPNGGTIFIYKANTGNELNHFTINNNDTWYNCDQPNASSNTSGTAQIIIGEDV